MNLADYQQAALGTAIYPGKGGPLGMAYVALKGAGEAGEFAAHALSWSGPELLAKEVGDELWYCAAKAFELGMELEGSFADIRPDETNCVHHLALHGAYLAGQFAEQVGKAIRDDGYGTAADHLTATRQSTLRQLVRSHLAHLATKAAALETSLGTIAEGNIAKLADRKARGVLGGSGDNR